MLSKCMGFIEIQDQVSRPTITKKNQYQKQNNYESKQHHRMILYQINSSSRRSYISMHSLEGLNSSILWISESFNTSTILSRFHDNQLEMPRHNLEEFRQHTGNLSLMIPRFMYCAIDFMC